MSQPKSNSAQKRFDDFEVVMRQVNTAWADDHFSTGFGLFREAANLSRGFSALEERVAALAGEQARLWQPSYGRLAEALLQEAQELEAQELQPKALKLRAPAAVVPIRHEEIVVHSPAQPKAKYSKTPAKVAFVGIAALVSGFLIFKQLPRSKTNSDQRAWAAVNPADADSVESYLNRFPTGANRPLAVQALVAYRRTQISQRQAAQVLETVRQYNTVHQVDLVPAADPVLDGEKATLRCRRQAGPNQPVDQMVTLVLARRDGAWNVQAITD